MVLPLGWPRVASTLEGKLEFLKMKISDTFMKCWRCDEPRLRIMTRVEDCPDATSDVIIDTELYCSDCLLNIKYGSRYTYQAIRNLGIVRHKMT